MDIHKRDIYPAMVEFSKGRIQRIEKVAEAPQFFVMPGLIDSHIHIESSMLTPELLQKQWLNMVRPL